MTVGAGGGGCESTSWKAPAVGFLRWVALSCAVAAIAGAYYWAEVDARGVLNWCLISIKEAGYWGPLLLSIAHTVAVVACFPGSILFEIAAGYFYGLVWGVAVVAVSKTVAACITFVLARTLLQRWVRARVSKSQRFEQIYDGVSRDGWKFVLLARLSVLPSSLVNYGVALTGISVKGYVFATALGALPMVCQNVYIGTTVTSLTADTDAVGSGNQVTGKVMLAVSCIGFFIIMRKVSTYFSASAGVVAPEEKVNAATGNGHAHSHKALNGKLQ
eukprot:jgi/Chlat1/2147/Chrsp17S02723